jgi:NAD(P)-dependent dehydrogenase (short-subunit alcohol dehydrogenase family)
MNKLNDKVVLITGASSGMGLAAAKKFVAEGAYVFITGRRQKELDQAVAAIGKNVTGVQGDAGNLADLDRLFEVIKFQKGRLDVVYANAGMGEFAAIGEVSEEHFDKIMGVNVRGLLFTIQKALSLLTDGASIILTGSIASIKGFPSFGVYNASKAAVRSFARTWVNDLKGRNIRVNVLSPGPVETGVFDTIPKEAKAAFVSMIPRGTIGQPEETANVALFLASDESSFVNGVELFVDGGTAQI